DGRIFTSRNGSTEPLNGVRVPAVAQTISTPGNMQTAVINIAGQLKKSVDLTPFNVDPDNLGEDPLFDPRYADDIIYGGLDSDWLHGGSGDDAISGAEALPVGAFVLYPEGSTDPARADGVATLSGYDLPVNPLTGNALGHEALRAEELAAYDEFDPWAKIFVDAGDSQREFFLNFNHAEGPAVGTVNTDGDDAIFGDLGNDWLVGGTGRDNLYGGYGNDLLNADDNLATAGNANTAPDGPEASYEDRAYGGAGRDVLIANTGGDRLIDWVGEFNAYITPFAPFGAATVSRTLQPQLPEFLYALSKADGADQTRVSGSTAARNGEPDGELGLVIQRDLDWRDQTGAPDDPQAGNIPGGRRDVLRSATFQNGSMALSAFAPDSGVWMVENGELKVAAASPRGDAVSVFHVDHQLPGYFEIVAQVRAEKPLAGWNANAYVIFDYVSATDFKFAGINVSTNKIEMGRRTAQGWIVDVQSSVQVKPEQYYTLLVAVNGTTVTVGVDSKTYFSYAYAPRVIDGYAYGLNWGLVGVGSNNARGSFDNIRAQVLPPAWTLQHTDGFGDGVADLFTGASQGAWQVAGGRYAVTPPSGDEGFSLVDLGLGRGVAANSVLELSTTFTAQGLAGLIFDQYGPENFKFVAVDVPGQRVVVGHHTAQRGLVIDASTARTVAPGDHTLAVTLKGTTVAILLDGQAVRGHVFNAVGVDGAFGLFARGGAASFDSVTIKTDDPAFRQTATALVAAGYPVDRGAVELLSEQTLDAVAAQAAAAWDGALQVSDIRLVVADLADGILGQTLGATIFVDDDAAGFGWFVDYRTAADAPAGGVDLLSVVSHELGHALGLAHGEGIMNAALAPGMRLFVGDPGAAAVEESLADTVPMFRWDRDAAEPAVVTGGRIDWGRALESGRAGLQPQFPAAFAAPTMTGGGFFSRLIDWTGRRMFGRSLTSERLGPQFPGFLIDEEQG
ncbi:MAG TPA: hypothetical protein VNN19_10005, partial [bacterium]|nr:hypothetical protein [bacterium]